MRIVSSPQGDVKIDRTGKMPGRGAYICADGKCAQDLLRRGRIEQALRTKLKDADWSELTATIETSANQEQEPTISRDAIQVTL